MPINIVDEAKCTKQAGIRFASLSKHRWLSRQNKLNSKALITFPYKANHKRKLFQENSRELKI